MKKIYLILFVLSITLRTSAQENNENNVNSSDTTPATKGFFLNVFLGKKYYQSSFYNQLNTLSNPSIKAPLTFVGLGYNGSFVVNQNYFYCGHLALLYIVPQKVSLDTHTLGKISGYVFSASVIGWDLFMKNQKLDLIVSLGANLGRLRLLKNEALEQKNNILAPMIAVSPSFKIKKIKLTFNFQYDLDLSRTSWRRMPFSKTGKISLNKFNQSGLSTLICIGRNLD